MLLSSSFLAFTIEHMLQSILEKTIKKHNLIVPGDRIGIALSGGVDSMVLLYTLKKLSQKMGFYICALHYEHGIRGEASVKDMQFVETMCQKYKVTLHVGQGDVPRMAQEARQNLEATAREARYAFFAVAKEKYHLQKIAVAHHIDDFAETFLLNLVRGTGRAGLTTMNFVRTPGIIRPMLEAKRSEIEAYAKKEQIPFVVDETNADTSYARNYIRKEIVPRLATLNPEVNQAIMRTSELLREEEVALEEMTEDAYRRIAIEKEGHVSLDIPALFSLPIAILRRVLRKAIAWCVPLFDIDKRTVDQVITLTQTGKTGKVFSLPGKFFARISYNTLIIEDKMYTIERTGSYPAKLGLYPLWQDEFFGAETVSRPEEYPSKTSLVQYVDGKILEGAVIRTRDSGDVFTPFGMTGTKKLKDWFIDAKVPRELRDSVPLLCKGNQVLWVIGHGLSDYAKVTKQTEQICKIYYQNMSREEKYAGA